MQVLLAKTWMPDINPSGFLISEKLDGVRSIWNGKHLLSREGNRFHAPDWFTAQLPNVMLDGELWLGRDMLQETVSIVTTERMDKGWNRITYMLFDVPDIRAPFEQRLEILRKVAGHIKICHVLDQIKCTSREHMDQALKVVKSMNGEGLMLRKPGSFYEHKRSSTLYKVKTWIDAEAVVIDHTPGKGKYVGMMGNLVCRLPSGVQFEIGTGFDDDDRTNPPPVGSTVMFKYNRMTQATNGKKPKPYIPVFRGPRPKGI